MAQPSWGGHGGMGAGAPAAHAMSGAPGSSQKTAYGFDMRVLACSHCGAPIEGTVHGPTVQCSYCQAHNQITARDERIDHQMLQAAPQLSEAQRFERLRQQDGRPLMPPPSLQPFLQGGGVPPGQVSALQQHWLAARQELHHGGGFQAAERLYFATMMLRDPMIKQGQDLQVRAMVETALDLLTEPRHRNVLHGMLARDAARFGDVRAAESWLGLMNPRSDDLHIDTAYRITRAYVSTARNDPQTVLSVLGQRKDDVPIADGQDTLAAVIRANAFERMGRTQEAAQQLQQLMVNPAQAQVVGGIISSNAALQLCSQTYPQVAHQVQQMGANIVKSKSGANTGPLFVVPFLAAPVLIGMNFLTTGVGLPGWVFGIAVAAAVVLILGLVFRSLTAGARAKAKLKQTGVRGRATLLEGRSTGTRINNQPVVELILTIEAQGMQPYQASHRQIMGYGKLHALQPGMVIPVRVDPQDRAMFALDW